jgi:hypothetical protein
VTALGDAHVSLFHPTGTGRTERNYLISYIVNMLKEICEDTLRCHSCKKPYHFRHCKNPKSTRGNNVYHAIELSCSDCGDYYTFKENKKRVIYFNIYVQEQVSRLKRSAKGLMIVTDRSLSHPAIVVIAKKETELPVLKINDWKVRKATMVKYYWDKAKNIQKSQRSVNKLEVEAISWGRKKVYYL